MYVIDALLAIVVPNFRLPSAGLFLTFISGPMGGCIYEAFAPSKRKPFVGTCKYFQSISYFHL